MRVRLVVGDVELRLDGLDLSKRQVVGLLREVGSVALALAEVQPVQFDPDGEGKPMGFTAHIDLDPDRNVGEDLSEWFEESP